MPQATHAKPAAGQAWDPEVYARNARFVSDLGMPVVELLAPQPGERVLDLGCGDGALTERLAAMGIAVVGVDASPEQIAAARRRGLDARVVDGAALPFANEFDAVFSNAALHWMTKPDPVIAGVWRALKPGGRFVGEMGGGANVSAITAALFAAMARRGHDPAAVMPWYFPSPDEYRARLAAAGFRVAMIDLIPRPTPLPGAMRDWLVTFSGAFTAALPEAERGPFLDEVAAALVPTLRRPDGQWVADYVRLRFKAVKPAE